MSSIDVLPLNQIIQNDSISVMRTFPNNCIDLIVADPPYNVLNNDNIELDNRSITRSVSFDKKTFDIEVFINEVSRILKDGGSFYIFSSDRQLGKYIECIEKCGLVYSKFLVWYHSDCAPSVRKRAFQSQCQLIVFGYKEIEKRHIFNFSNSEEMRDLLQYRGCVSFEYKGGSPGEYVGHPTQKPTKLIKKLIAISSNENDVVLDPFVGSGTTVVSAKVLKRKWIGIEINPDYCEISKNRLKETKVSKSLISLYGV